MRGTRVGTGRPSQAICWGRAGAPSEKYPHDGMGADRLPTSPQPATSTQAASPRPYCAQGRARGETQGAGEDPTQQGAASPQGASLWLHPGTRAQQQQGFLVRFLKNKIRNKVLLQKASPQLLRKAVNVSGSSRDRSFAMTEAPRRMER